MSIHAAQLSACHRKGSEPSNSVHAPLQSIGLFPGWFAPPNPIGRHNFTLTGFVRYDRGEGRWGSAELTTFACRQPPRSFSRQEVRCSTARRFRGRIGATQRFGPACSSRHPISEQLLPDFAAGHAGRSAMCRSASCFPRGCADLSRRHRHVGASGCSRDSASGDAIGPRPAG